jgi:hypothetical protein
VIGVVREMNPSDPCIVTVSVAVPQLPSESVRVDDAEPLAGTVMLAGLKPKLVDDRQEGRFVADNDTVPAYPLRLVPVTVT